MKQVLTIVENHGGWSEDVKQGPKNSFYYSRHIDFRKSATSQTLLPKTSKESSTTVTDLVTDMVQLPSGKIVGIGDAGGVYSRTTGGSWSKHGTTLTNTAAGMFYVRAQDRIYVPGLTTMGAVYDADGVFSGGTFTPTNSVFTNQVDQSAASSANTYTTTGAVTETATHKLSITPATEPLYSVKIWVTTKGTGDLVLTMHDAANNTLGSKTVANASLTNGALNEFVFSTPVRMNVKPNASTYHFHITHPSGTASTIGATTASDFSTARFQSMSNRLVSPINGLHPCINFLQYACIGNERYLAVWEPISMSAPTATEFQQHRLTFPPGYEVTSLAVWNEYLAIACERRSTTATQEFQDGKIFLWDGTSQTYNIVIDVPEGAPYSIYSHKNALYWFAGRHWWAWSGGQQIAIFQFRNTDFEYSGINNFLIGNPHMMGVRGNILLGAFPSQTNSTSVEHAVYSFGSRSKNYDESFGYSYSISTGTRTFDGTNALRLGSIKSLGDKLLVSWRDDTQSSGEKYGVDIVDSNNNPFSTGTWESLIFDAGRPDKQKGVIKYRIDFKALPTGATITPKYQIDRSGSYTSGTAATAGATSVTLPINKRFKEIQLADDWVATTSSPEILARTLVLEDLRSEQD